MKMNMSTLNDGIQKKYSILIVEDNEINRDIMSRYVKKYFEPEVASDPQEALSKLETKKYDAILMDINLGSEMSGIDLVKILREKKEFKDLPIIAITGYSLFGDREKILKEGFSHYLPKPFEKQDLLNLLNSIFNFEK